MSFKSKTLKEQEKILLYRCFEIRPLALKICYSITGYAESNINTKNFIYDAVVGALSQFEK